MAKDSHSPKTRGRRLSLKPPHRNDHPNPHKNRSLLGRAPLPTPSTVAAHVWQSIGVESHIILTLLLPVFVGVIWFLGSLGASTAYIIAFIALTATSYALYYLVAPREPRNVIARLENLYSAKRFAVVSSGIAAFTIVSATALAVVYPLDHHPNFIIARTSVTVATVGMGIGIASSYVLVRVLVARALPTTTRTTRIEKAVNNSSAFEFAFILAAVGAPLFIFTAALFWYGPELIVLEHTIANADGSLLLLGLVCLYTSLVTRL